MLDELRDPLLLQLSLLLAVLIARIADLAGLFQPLDSKFAEVDLAEPGALVLADVFGADEVLDSVVRE